MSDEINRTKYRENDKDINSLEEYDIISGKIKNKTLKVKEAIENYKKDSSSIDLENESVSKMFYVGDSILALKTSVNNFINEVQNLNEYSSLTKEQKDNLSVSLHAIRDIDYRESKDNISMPFALRFQGICIEMTFKEVCDKLQRVEENPAKRMEDLEHCSEFNMVCFFSKDGEIKQNYKFYSQKLGSKSEEQEPVM